MSIHWSRQFTFFLFYKKVKEKDASGKNAKLSWCKCIFDQIKANLAEIQPKNDQNDQETSFLQKAPGVNRLRYNFCVIL